MGEMKRKGKFSGFRIFSFFLSLVSFVFLSAFTVNEANNRLGVHLLYCDPGDDMGTIDRIISSAKDIGAGWVRVGLIWDLANPSPGKYDFSFYDWFFQRLSRAKLSPLVVVIFTPNWCSSGKGEADYYLYPPTEDEISDGKNGYYFLYAFAKRIAGRYKGIVNYWEFWNEPDMGSIKDINHNGRASDEYAKMLYYFYRGIKEANPDAKVLLGGLAQDRREVLCDCNFFEEFLGEIKFHPSLSFDIHNIHTNFKSIPMIEEQFSYNRRIMRERNFEKEIWVTESSYSPKVRFQILPGYFGGTAAFNKYIFDVLIHEGSLTEGVVFWTPLFDYGKDTPEDDPYKYNGLLTNNLREKPAAKIFRFLARSFLFQGLFRPH